MSDLVKLLMQNFQETEDACHEVCGKIWPNIFIHISRRYDGQLSFHYSVSSAASASTKYEEIKTSGTMPHEVLAEFIRRFTFNERQNAVLLEAPAEEATPVDEIPY